MNNLQKTLPPSTARSRGIETILQTCGQALEQVESEARAACVRLTAGLADQAGAALWERELGLEIREDLPLEARRALILAALEQMETCTPRRLLALLARLIEGEGSLREDFPAYHLYLTVQAARFLVPSLRLVERVLRQTIPAHLGASLAVKADLETEPRAQRGLFQGIHLEIDTVEEELA